MTAPLQPTWTGYVSSTKDALVLVEGCLQGGLNHVPRRPHDRERPSLIRSGSVFIYEENASGIKRWTDGVPWSPSRILGNFLVYRELTKPFPPGEKKRATKRSKRPTRPGEPYPRPNADGTPVSPTTPGARSDSGLDREGERALIGSLVDSYGFKDGGLVKKTITVQVNGIHHHMVSYYNIEDVLEGRLQLAKADPRLVGVTPRSELVTRQNFRSPLDSEEDQQQESLQSAHQLMHGGGYEQYAYDRRSYSNGMPHGHQAMNMTLYGSDSNPYVTSAQLQHGLNGYAAPPQAPHGFYGPSQPMQQQTPPAYSQPPYPPQHPPQPLMPHDRPSAQSQQADSHHYNRQYAPMGLTPRPALMATPTGMNDQNGRDSAWGRGNGGTGMAPAPSGVPSGSFNYTINTNGSPMNAPTMAPPLPRNPNLPWSGGEDAWHEHHQNQLAAQRAAANYSNQHE
jgi:hypothetical protein